MDINRGAPVVASAEALIRAPRRLVWEVQADIEGWSQWNPGVSRARLQGPLAPGTTFKWKAGGLPITSTLREVEPERRLVWTGRSLSLRAVHVWTFEEEADGTRVYTEESFEGWLARLFPDSLQRMLASSLEQGLDALKKACERRAGAVEA